MLPSQNLRLRIVNNLAPFVISKECRYVSLFIVIYQLHLLFLFFYLKGLFWLKFRRAVSKRTPWILISWLLIRIFFYYWRVLIMQFCWYDCILFWDRLVLIYKQQCLILLKRHLSSFSFCLLLITLIFIWFVSYGSMHVSQ